MGGEACGGMPFDLFILIPSNGGFGIDEWGEIQGISLSRSNDETSLHD
jgi:hypothetical protein